MVFVSQCTEMCRYVVSFGPIPQSEEANLMSFLTIWSKKAFQTLQDKSEIMWLSNWKRAVFLISYKADI